MGDVPYVIAESHFIAHFGVGMMHYRGDLTSDGVIPFKLFCLFLGAAGSVRALETLSAVRATVLALALTFGDSKAKRTLDRLIRETTHA